MPHWIDPDHYTRKEQYAFFSRMDYPHFNVCANVEITAFYRFVKQEGYPFFASTVFAAAKAANAVEEFRHRIRDGRVYVHDVVSPSYTVLSDSGAFGFCEVDFTDDFGSFVSQAAARSREARQAPSLDDESRDDLLFVTSLPWVTFTAISLPIHMHPADSVPRLSWGKFFEDRGRILLPFSVQAHHALVDGIHVGRYFELLQSYFDDPALLCRANPHP